MVTGYPDDRGAEEEARDAEDRARGEDEETARQAGLSAQAEAEARNAEAHELDELLRTGAVAVVNISPNKDSAAQALYQEGLNLRDLALRRVIKSDADVKFATDDLVVIGSLVKKLGELRKKYEAPFKEHLATFRATFESFIAPLVEAERINKDKWGTYRREVEAAKARAEETNRMAEDVARRQAEESGTGEITVNTEPVPVPETANTIRSSVGTGSAYKTPKYRVVDFKLLPDEYKLPDAGKLTRVIKAAKGQIQIPGVEITFEDVLSVRSK